MLKGSEKSPPSHPTSPQKNGTVTGYQLWSEMGTSYTLQQKYIILQMQQLSHTNYWELY
jgi:hypothetical protein